MGNFEVLVLQTWREVVPVSVPVPLAVVVINEQEYSIFIYCKNVHV